MQTQVSLILWNFFIYVVSILCPVVPSYCYKGIETGAGRGFEGSANEGEGKSRIPAELVFPTY